MFYKFNIEANEWHTGIEIHFPDGTKINSENKLNHDGWEWHDTAPLEYLEWLKTQEI